LPRIDHPDLGAVVNTKYVSGTITAVDRDLDTADIESEADLGLSLFAVPIFYH